MITKELDKIFEKLMTERNAYKGIEGESATSINAIRQNWRRDLISQEKKAVLVEKAGYEVEIKVKPVKKTNDVEEGESGYKKRKQYPTNDIITVVHEKKVKYKKKN